MVFPLSPEYGFRLIWWAPRAGSSSSLHPNLDFTSRNTSQNLWRSKSPWNFPLNAPHRTTHPRIRNCGIDAGLASKSLILPVIEISNWLFSSKVWVGQFSKVQNLKLLYYCNTPRPPWTIITTWWCISEYKAILGLGNYESLKVSVRLHRSHT